VRTYTLTVFAGAFLLFQVQPVIGKYILPWFGGGPAVWTTCMLFFQMFLLGGYAYAHLSTRYLRPRSQAVLHIALLVAALSQLPITPAAAWKPAAVDYPTWRILALLITCLGLPYLLLSSTGPLMQRWHVLGNPGTSPYRLYGHSNIGSLLAVLTYPFLVEPTLPRNAQGSLWSAGFGLYALLAGLCAMQLWRLRLPSGVLVDGATPDNPTDRPTLATRILWLGLPACASLLLLAVTNQLCEDVAAIPFLWLLPLYVYLLSFILCFESDSLYYRPVFAGALVLAMVGACWLLFSATTAVLPLQIAGHSAVLFVCCTVCHGELARLKPHPRYLTSYYLMIAAGGALGGAMVALGAPLAFDSYAELHLGLLGCCLLALVACSRDSTSALYGWRPRWAWACLSIAILGLGGLLRYHVTWRVADPVAISRNFYGVLSVERSLEATEWEGVELFHGNTRHGHQFLAPEKRRVPTSYYGVSAGVGLVLRFGSTERPRRIGVVGLGVGTIAAYGRRGDYLRFYEINPDVVRIARTHFTYLADSPAQIDVILGDARLSLEREPAQRFDILILDAFSSDAIPIHLLTKEAFELYLGHLRENGLIVAHASNRHLDLEDPIRRVATDLGLGARVIVDDGRHVGHAGSTWVVVTRNQQLLDADPLRTASQHIPTPPLGGSLWTDDYASLLNAVDIDDLDGIVEWLLF
jgi:hypothetical protein